MTTIRLMRDEDVDAVREIDALAFGAWERQVSGRMEELPRRTRANVQACREKDAEGAFVAEDGGRAVGFIFSRTWGSVSWFGPFAVLPEHQGRGIGKELIAASLAYLRREPRLTIGLETMADSPYDMGLYLRRGFHACPPTFFLTRRPAPLQRAPAGLDRWSGADAETRTRWLADLRAATGQIRPGLDYSNEIVLGAGAPGDTLVLSRDGRAVGFSAVALASSREGARSERTSVTVMALHPAWTTEETFGALLDGSEALAAAHGKEALLVPANGRRSWALEQLLARGYRVTGVRIRMTLPEAVEPGAPGMVDLQRWAG